MYRCFGPSQGHFEHCSTLTDILVPMTTQYSIIILTGQLRSQRGEGQTHIPAPQIRCRNVGSNALGKWALVQIGHSHFRKQER